MSWSDTIYLQFSDEATARALALQLGVEFPPDGTIPTGNANFALTAPITEWLSRPTYALVDDVPTMTDPGQQRAGYWAMLRLNMDWPGYAGTMIVLSPYIQSINNPSNAYAGDVVPDIVLMSAADVTPTPATPSLGARILSAVASFFAPDPVG